MAKKLASKIKTCSQKVLKKVSLPTVLFSIVAFFSCFLFTENRRLQKRVTILAQENTRIEEEFKKEVELIDGRVKLQANVLGKTTELGEASFIGLVSTVKDLEDWKFYIDDFVDTYNEAVDIYNSQVADLYNRTDNNRQRINNIIEILKVTTGY